MPRDTFHNKRRLFLNVSVIACLLLATQSFARTLPELIINVLDIHPALLTQRLLQQSAQDGVKAAEWQFYPTPSVSVERVQTSATDPSYRYGNSSVTALRLQQPLWTGGRLTAGLDKAKAGVDSSAASLQSVRQDTALRVIQIYSDWNGAYLRGVAAEKSLEVHLRLREQIDRRIAEGLSATSDLTLLLSREDQTSAELAVAKSQQVNSLARLAQLLGAPVNSGELLSSVAPPLPISTQSLAFLVAQAQAESPSVKKLIAQSRVYEADIAEKKSYLTPEVNLRIERQYGSYSVASSATQNRVFVSLSTRFGAGLSGSADVSGARARYQSSLADIDSTRISIGEQVVSDYLLAQSGQRRLFLLISSLKSSEFISEAWGRQFLAGRKTWLDVMNAARELAQVEAQIAEIQANQLVLTWRLSLLVRGLDPTLSDSKNSIAEIVK